MKLLPRRIRARIYSALLQPYFEKKDPQIVGLFFKQIEERAWETPIEKVQEWLGDIDKIDGKYPDLTNYKGKIEATLTRIIKERQKGE